MPAGSDAPGTRPALPIIWRPFGARIAAIIAAVALLAILTMLWISFGDDVRAQVTTFQRGTVIVVVGLGMAVLHALARSRVEAHEDRLVVVNGYRRHEFDWAQIVAVHLGAGAPWVTLDLADGETASAMGIQGSDGTRARQALRDLRALLDR